MTDESKQPEDLHAQSPEQLLTGRDKMIAIGTANLEAHRAATQWNGERGNKPNMAEGGANTKPYSIRNQTRYYAGQLVDADGPPKKLTGVRITRAQKIALKALDMAEDGDIRAIEWATEQVDGKLAQANINADFAYIKNMSDEQLDEALDKFERERQRERNASNGDVSGEEAAPGSASPAGGKA